MPKKEFKKNNLLETLYLKVTNKKLYKKYKYQLAEQELKSTVDRYLSQHHKESFNSIEELEKLPVITVVHSGNAGDIIYSLPTLKKIWQLTGKKVHFLLKLNQPHNIGAQYDHPLGGVMLNEKMASMLKPLLESQSYIAGCDTFSDQHIDINLDNFRKCGIMLDRGDISRWCGYITGIMPEPYKPWLEVEPDKRYNRSIVISRSARYRNPTFDYTFLNQYEDVYFIGVRSEYDDMKTYVNGIKWAEVDTFHEMAQVIKGSKLFIGNQSFPFAVAEALKVPRVLEMCVFAPNVIPQGPNGYDVYFQDHLESLINSLMNG